MVTKYLIMPSIRYVMYINPVEAYGIVDFPAHIVESSRARAERATRRLINRLKSAGVKGLKTETQVCTTSGGDGGGMWANQAGNGAEMPLESTT